MMPTLRNRKDTVCYAYSVNVISGCMSTNGTRHMPYNKLASYENCVRSNDNVSRLLFITAKNSTFLNA